MGARYTKRPEKFEKPKGIHNHVTTRDYPYSYLIIVTHTYNKMNKTFNNFV